MANNQDARPFVDLRKDAEEFNGKFNEDIKECINFLDAKITALICDPDSLGNPIDITRQNAASEFSKAKYEIYIGVKSLINRKEREWLDYISEMKKLFVENVEIFLAGTKLEVKLPSTEFQPSLASRKSLSNQKSVSSATSSVFPIINNLAKNISVLSSPLQSKYVSTKEASDVGGSIQSNRRSRLSATSIKLANSSRFLEANETEDVEMDSDEVEFDFTASHSDSKSSTVSKNDLNASQSTSKRRSNSRKEINIGSSSGIPGKNVPASEKLNSTTASMPTRGRRGKLSVQTTNLNNELQEKNNSGSEDSEESGRSDQIADSLPVSSKKFLGRSSKLKNAATLQKGNSSSEDSEEVGKAKTTANQVKGRRGRQAKNREINSSENQITENISALNVEEPILQNVSSKVRRGRSAMSKNSENVSDKFVTTRTPSRNHKALKSVSEETQELRTPSKSPKKVTFTTEGDISDDLDVYTPVARPVKPAARRKTLLTNLDDTSDSDIIPGKPNRSKSKRKTFCGVSEIESVAPPKRLKVSNQKRISSIQEEDNTNDNLLESDGNYSQWMALKNIDGKIPTRPAIYEVKVWRAKKPAYIGSCESLCEKLTLYKLRQNSGHKHLDKFVERNYNDIQVRFEVVSSVDDAKEEVKKRISSFVSQHKTTPAYN